MPKRPPPPGPLNLLLQLLRPHLSGEDNDTQLAVLLENSMRPYKGTARRWPQSALTTRCLLSLLLLLLFNDCYDQNWASQGALVIKNLPANAGDIRDVGLIPGLGRSPGEGKGNPCQYPCLENPMDRGAWWATVHGVVKSQTQLKD